MKIEQLPGYGYPALAFWIEYWYEGDRWRIKEYKLQPDGKLKWFDQYNQVKPDVVKGTFFENKGDALAYVNLENLNLDFRVSVLELSEEDRASIKLKVDKAIQAKTRLMNEEELMLVMAIKKHQDHSKPAYEDIILPNNELDFKESLFSQLNIMPYLKVALVQNGKDRKVIFKNIKNEWSKTYNLTPKTFLYTERAKVANGFGLGFDYHWGKTKAIIRTKLLPVANQLLQLNSVKMLLKEAEARGQKVLVSNGYVFWFEDHGNIGWQIKQVKQTNSETSEGQTIWKEGTILSKNHGRLVILPYIKENGEYVQGHTKNAPHDGPAKPRMSSEYVELPFEILQDDLMIGLFGELKYE